MIVRRSEAEWTGGLREGQGKMKLGSGAYEGAYSFRSRMESGPGANPEELIAAAHAGCFSMATAFQLSGAGHPPESLHCDATLTLDQIPGGFQISAVHLVLKAKVPGLDNDKFQALAADAKANCPVSKVLNAEITLEATLL